ncbi:DNA-binding MarR family transcriptional regulator [Pedobacter cryoconitis]|uniref:DNA-binding MarR family transcriptional regulator n=1 Tax=Pedobacter cryoconitis TaxID=188932 RepID=A0A7W8ZS01_9SPHI|nr:MarR family transcriptional regulator [Pedobacter cryoconitis]MBB5638968.1 DNA-binding MarR family transcriptional regulator [Pedobacter cryoconitis]
MEYAFDQDRLIFKQLYILKHHTDKLAADQLANLVHSDFNITFMPYFMNIGHQGISNHNLVNKIMVTKQGVSKTVKELERLGLAYTRKSETDARSIMIFLTEDGKKLHDTICKMADEVTSDYIKLVGAKKYEQFIDTFIKISKWHESQEKLQ